MAIISVFFFFIFDAIPTPSKAQIGVYVPTYRFELKILCMVLFILLTVEITDYGTRSNVI